MTFGERLADAVAARGPLCVGIDPHVPLLERWGLTDDADGLSMINTLLGLVIDPDTLRPVLGGVTGGLSGPAIRPVALRCVWQVHAALPHVPILGMGGIRTGLDALQFVLAGASAVSVGTAVFNDPSVIGRVHEELAAALAARGFASLSDAVGLAHRPVDGR